MGEVEAKPVEALFLGPHPDDVELFCGGTVLRMLDAGCRVAIADLTQGEMGTKGTPELRRAECEAATAALGLAEADRSNLGLPDTGLTANPTVERRLVEEIRRVRPRLLFAPHERDVHPDHTATAVAARRAFFLSGLAKFEPDLGAPFRPDALLRFPGNDHVEPSFCVDISDLVDRKRKVVECYRSQVAGNDTTHYARKLDPLQRAAARERYFGSMLGCAAAEPFIADAPLLVRDLSSLFRS